MQQLISITLSQQGWKNTGDNGVFLKIGGRKGGELDDVLLVTMVNPQRKPQLGRLF